MTRTDSSNISWEQFLRWAREENDHQKAIAGVHPADYPDPALRGRTFFEVCLYRYYCALRICWPHLNRPNQKVMDVGSWPGAWLRAISHFASQHTPEVWASGLIFPPDFMEKMGGACHGMMKCELDPWSPLAEREAPNVFTQRGFTFVSAMEVVEHLYHPGWFFKIIHEAMAPGGILFITTNNITRFSNLVNFLQGGGLVGDVDELLPRGGGKLGGWRPHMREYCWRELNHIGLQAGFRYVAHGFNEDNYARRFFEGEDQPNDDVVPANHAERRLLEATKPLLSEADQLRSGMYLLFQKV